MHVWYDILRTRYFRRITYCVAGLERKYYCIVIVNQVDVEFSTEMSFLRTPLSPKWGFQKCRCVDTKLALTLQLWFHKTWCTLGQNSCTTRCFEKLWIMILISIFVSTLVVLVCLKPSVGPSWRLIYKSNFEVQTTTVHHNESFEITCILYDRWLSVQVLRMGNFRNDDEGFLPVYLSNAAQPKPPDRFEQLLYQSSY